MVLLWTWLQEWGGRTNEQKLSCADWDGRQTIKMLKLVFLVSCLVPLALCYPYYPSTCYSKVLVKAQEVNHLAAYVKSAPAVVSWFFFPHCWIFIIFKFSWLYFAFFFFFQSTCVAHLPAFHVDVHVSIHETLKKMLKVDKFSQGFWLKVTNRCFLPSICLSRQNGCVMYKMRRYISLVDGLRHHGCAYNAELRRLGSNLKQLHLILRDRCHGVRTVHTGGNCWKKLKGSFSFTQWESCLIVFGSNSTHTTPQLALPIVFLSVRFIKTWLTPQSNRSRAIINAAEVHTMWCL